MAPSLTTALPSIFGKKGKIPYTSHPFQSLSPSEIEAAAAVIKAEYPSDADLHYKAITLQEPEKEVVKIWLAADQKPSLDRRAFVLYYLRNTEKFFEAIVNLSTSRLESNLRLGANEHGPGDGEEIMNIERTVLENPEVQALIAKLELPDGYVVVSDPWIYGSDGVDDDRRQFQCYLYTRPTNSPSSNHYASPLSFSPVVDSITKKVIRVDYLPLTHTFDAVPPVPFKPTINEYAAEYHTLRTDLKPLNVVQPQGASFTVDSDGESIEWQKWKFRVGFNYREGMVIYNTSYAGRSLFYRLSLSDMAIPYADPRPPYHRKQAFDLGDAGAGVMANNLKLGCDCLGAIHYLSFPIASHTGESLMMDNCVCVHEQDAGILAKHTNYRTLEATIIRNRELVVQSIITVSNYEYILAFIFNLAGELSYEVRATGIVSTAPIDPIITTSPEFGTIVSAGVLASHHQHIFSLRIDPAIDGFENTVVYEEAKAMPRDEKTNPYGTGYTISETSVTTSSGLNESVEANRTFKITNPSKKNAINGKSIGYKIQAPPFQKILALPDSFHHKRAEFADKAVYVTKYAEGELYAGGKYTNQSRGGTGVRSWAAREDNLKKEGDDVVVWVQFGINHVVRIEDFPLMSAEMIRVNLKPSNFFERNPGLDVPSSTQEVNKSVLLNKSEFATGNGEGSHGQGGAVEAVVDEKGGVGEVKDTCCS